MNITIINDCRDGNAEGRQAARAATLTGHTTSFIGVASDLEAAGNLIDALDAYEGQEGAILVNVAPRNGAAKKWENGTPFGYFWYRQTLVVASIDGFTLSLVKKLGLAETINVLDIPTVMRRFVAEGVVSEEVGERVIHTQFRSFEFVPRVAAYLLKNKEVDSEAAAIADVPDAPSAVWWIDNFGNCKTTMLKREITGGSVETAFGTLQLFEQLKDVPDGETALVAGSSGIGDERFVELVVQGESAAKKHGINTGQSIFEAA